jgi:hypothetical protein
MHLINVVSKSFSQAVYDYPAKHQTEQFRSSLDSSTNSTYEILRGSPLIMNSWVRGAPPRVQSSVYYLHIINIMAARKSFIKNYCRLRRESNESIILSYIGPTDVYTFEML